MGHSDAHIVKRLNQRGYTGLSVEECKEYWLIKEAVLQTTRVDPETTLQKCEENAKLHIIRNG